MPAATSSSFSVVKSPPAEPPIVGLLASLSGPYNLIGDAEVDEFGHPARWEGGFAYAPEQMCLRTGAFDPCSQVTQLSIPANPARVDVMPFGIAAGDACSAFGWEARDFEGRATRALIATESAQIAGEFWSGTAAKAAGWPNNYLASSLANVLSVGAVTPVQALACLEQGIADSSNGQRGAIHVTPQLGSIFSDFGNTLRTVDGVIMTYRGTIIIPDAGYPGTGPAGQARLSDSQWAYATLLPVVRRSQIVLIPEGTDRDNASFFQNTNLFEYRAERLAAVSFPPCTHVAVQVNVPLCGGGS